MISLYLPTGSSILFGFIAGKQKDGRRQWTIFWTGLGFIEKLMGDRASLSSPISKEPPLIGTLCNVSISGFDSTNSIDYSNLGVVQGMNL